jgi:hypothetical protein
VRKNGASGNNVCPITAAATGLIQDTTHTDTFAVDDYFGYMLSTGTGAGETITVVLYSVDITSTAGVGYAIGGSSIAPGAGTTVFNTISGQTAAATELNAAVKALAAGTMSNFATFIPIGFNTVLATSTIRPRINSADGNQVVTYATLADGYVEDTTHTDTFVATDVLGVSVAVGAGGAQITVATQAMRGLDRGLRRGLVNQ